MAFPSGGYASAAAAATDGMMHYWALDETGTDVTLVDQITTNPLDGTLTSESTAGESHTTGKFNNGIKLLTSTPYVQLPGTGSETTSTLTLSQWCYFTSVPPPSGWIEVLFNINNHNASVSNNGIYVLVLTGGNGAISVNYANNKNFSTGSNYVSAGWNHIAFTVNVTTGAAVLYINGSSAGTSSATAVAIKLDSAAGPMLGNVLADYYPREEIDDIGIWDRVLTPAEITEIYNSGTGTALINPATVWTRTIIEASAMTDASAGFEIFAETLTETIGDFDLNDSVTSLVVQALYDSMNIIGATPSTVMSMVNTLTEAPSIADVLTSLGTHNPAIINSFNINEALSSMLSAVETIPEAIQLAENYATNMNMGNTLTEAPNIPTVIAGNLVISKVVAEDSSILDAASSMHALGALISDNMSFITTFVLNNETYTGVAINTENRARTQYLGYNFNSMCRFDGAHYGAKEDGIHLLDGSDDAGTDIEASILTGITDFNSDSEKRVMKAYLGMRNDGNIVLKTTVTDAVDGLKREYWYEVSDTSTGVRTSRIKMSRGLKAAYWQFEVSNKDGSDFELDLLELIPIILTRKM